MLLENIICFSPYENNQLVKCIECKISNLLVREISENPVLKCFLENSIFVKMDNVGNSLIIGYSGDPHLLLAAILQTDAYQIGLENFSCFQITIQSLYNESDSSVNCSIQSIKNEEEKTS